MIPAWRHSIVCLSKVSSYYTTSPESIKVMQNAVDEWLFSLALVKKEFFPMQIWQQLIHAAAVLSLRYEAQGKFREEERCVGATVVVTSSWEKNVR